MSPDELKPELFWDYYNLYPDSENNKAFTQLQMADALENAMNAAVEFADYRSECLEYEAWRAKIKELRGMK